MHSNSDQIGETNKDINYCDYSSSSSFCYGYQTVKRGPKIDCQWRWGNWSSCTRECASYIGLSVSTRYFRKLENFGPNQPMCITFSWHPVQSITFFLCLIHRTFRSHNASTHTRNSTATIMRRHGLPSAETTVRDLQSHQRGGV